MVSQIVPVTAGEIRRNKFNNNSFERRIGINTDDFTFSNEGCALTVTPPEIALNSHRIVHGGWTAALFDTVATGAAYTYQTGGLADNEYGLTAALDIKFDSPVLPGRTYTCKGGIIGREGNNIHTQATVIDSEGKQVANAKALVKARRPDYPKQAA